VRRSAPANFGAPLPSLGVRRVRMTIWHDSPPGCAARQRSRTSQQNARRNHDAPIEADNHRSAVSGRCRRPCRSRWPKGTAQAQRRVLAKRTRGLRRSNSFSGSGPTKRTNRRSAVLRWALIAWRTPATLRRRSARGAVVVATLPVRSTGLVVLHAAHVVASRRPVTQSAAAAFRPGWRGCPNLDPFRSDLIHASFAQMHTR
jgi:hypothetical protein